ncbi:hypothetical protein [Mesorhizobium sp. IMUNJ 23232]|uniref:hypothetical protein n=1 Tax=Mesorhizobium sp. IMUNJ 23232 TaxID=3376064 RepID=UPI003790C378
MRRPFTLLLIGVAAGALASCASVEDTMLMPLKYANGKLEPTATATRKPALSSQEAAGPTAGPVRKRVYRRKAPVSQPVQAPPTRERSGPGGGGGGGGGSGGGGGGGGGGGDGPGGGGWG